MQPRHLGGRHSHTTVVPQGYGGAEKPVTECHCRCPDTADTHRAARRARTRRAQRRAVCAPGNGTRLHHRRTCVLLFSSLFQSGHCLLAVCVPSPVLDVMPCCVGPGAASCTARPRHGGLSRCGGLCELPASCCLLHDDPHTSCPRCVCHHYSHVSLNDGGTSEKCILL